MTPDELKLKLLQETDYFVDTAWLDKYTDLVLNNAEGSHVPKKTHSHHIIPVSYFTSRKLPVDHSEENRVELSFKNHMLAHFYLSGCTKGRDRYKNLYALFHLSHFDKEGYLDIQNYDKYEQLYSEAIGAAPNHRKGTKCSDETRAKMRVAQRKLQTERGFGCTKDTVWMNNGVKDTMVKTSEVDKYLAEGYKRGRLYKHSPETVAKVVSKNTGRQVSDAFRERMREAGRLSSLNRDPESYKKQGQMLKQYYQTHPNPFAGKHHSEEALEQNRLAHLGRKKINKDGVVKCIHPEELEDYLANGWQLGMGKSKPTNSK